MKNKKKTATNHFGAALIINKFKILIMKTYGTLPM